MNLFGSRNALVQGAVPMRRQFDFVEHTMLHRVDPSMLGRTRLLTRYEGGVVSVRSDITIPTDAAKTVFDHGSAEIVVPGHVNMDGYLLLVAGTELVVVIGSTWFRDFNDYNKYTTLTLENPLRASYPQASTFDIIGFPLAPASYYNAGTTSMQFDAPVFVVAGDEIAVYSAPSNIPVVGRWQEIDIVLDQAGSPANERFSVSLAIPLQQDITPDNRLFLRAVPAYLSPMLPIQEEILRRGSVLVDAMSGKVFGTGTDSMQMSVTLADANKETVSCRRVTKNAFLEIGSPACSDFVLWRHRVGTTKIESVSAQHASALCDSNGCYEIGVVLPYPVRFSVSLSSPAPFKCLVRTSGTGAVTTESVAGADAEVAVVDVASETSGFVIITILGTQNQQVEMQSARQSTIQYLSYGFRVALDVTEQWEGSGLLLKPTLPSLLDMVGSTSLSDHAADAVAVYSNNSGLQFNTGVLL